MEHHRESKEGVEIVEEEESPQVHRGVFSDPSPETRGEPATAPLTFFSFAKKGKNIPAFSYCNV